MNMTLLTFKNEGMIEKGERRKREGDNDVRRSV